MNNWDVYGIHEKLNDSEWIDIQECFIQYHQYLSLIQNDYNRFTSDLFWNFATSSIDFNPSCLFHIVLALDEFTFQGQSLFPQTVEISKATKCYKCLKEYFPEIILETFMDPASFITNSEIQELFFRYYVANFDLGPMADAIIPFMQDYAMNQRLYF